MKDEQEEVLVVVYPYILCALMQYLFKNLDICKIENFTIIVISFANVNHRKILKNKIKE